MWLQQIHQQASEEEKTKSLIVVVPRQIMLFLNNMDKVTLTMDTVTLTVTPMDMESAATIIIIMTPPQVLK